MARRFLLERLLRMVLTICSSHVRRHARMRPTSTRCITRNAMVHGALIGSVRARYLGGLLDSAESVAILLGRALVRARDLVHTLASMHGRGASLAPMHARVSSVW